MRGVWVFLFMLLISVGDVLATQSTQQYSQIYLNPYYRSAMSNGVNYTYNATINPPDGLQGIVSAIVRADIYLTPTVTFYLWVNGQVCNTPSYLVHTTYMDSGLGRVSFDCSNIISKAGTYNITIRPSAANTGASNAWLDLTYMNDPAGKITVSGTEYAVGDKATVFLQVVDDQGFPENSAGCFVDIYYPEMVNLTHPLYISNAPLMYKTDSEGMYYYDLTIPNVTGVYMLSASCSYSFGAAFCYALSGDTFAPERTIIWGTYGGNPIFLNGFEDSIYTSCASSAGATKACEAYYDYNLSVHFTAEQLSNITAIQLFYTGEANYPALQTFYWWNWSGAAWVVLPNSLTMSGASTTGAPIGVNDFQSNYIPVEAINSTTKIIRIRTYASYGIAFTLYSNWINMKVLTLTGNIHELKGNSEMHVTYHLNWIESMLSSIWNWLTVTLWQKILGMEQTLNAIYNNTNVIMTQQLNGTGKIAEVINQSTVKLLSASFYSGESGKLYVQVLKGDLPVNDVNCVLTAYYPNSSSYINALMTAKGENGLYYYNMTPLIRGFYAVSAKCENGSFTRTIYTSGSFEVSDLDQISVIS